MNKSLTEFIWIKGDSNPTGLQDTGFKSLLYNHSVLYYKENINFSPFELQQAKINLSNSFTIIFYYQKGNISIVSSSFELISPYILQEDINELAIKEFIYYNTTLIGKTIFTNVNSLTGISSVCYNDSQQTFEFVKDKSEEEIMSINKIFQRRLEFFVDHVKNLHHAVFLSGGYESRINTAIAAFYGLKTTLVTWGHPDDIEFIIADKIARKLKLPHISIRPDASVLPYMEYARKTGFLSNIQYAYRYRAVQMVKEVTGADVLWTGWGDINGFPSPGKPTELFSSYFQARARGKEYYPSGWNASWLAEGEKVDFPFDIDPLNPIPGVMEANRKTLAPLIFGQVLSAENAILPVFAPWHHPSIYSAIGRMEEKHPGIRDNKYRRVLLKGKIYYSLLRKYQKELNLIPVSKGFYPFWFHPAFGPLAPALAGLQKKITRKRKFPFDPVEDRMFLKKELDSIINSDIIYFDKEQIGLLASNSAHWSGPDIMEIFKIIQVYWFRKSLDEK